MRGFASEVVEVVDLRSKEVVEVPSHQVQHIEVVRVAREQRRRIRGLGVSLQAVDGPLDSLVQVGVVDVDQGQFGNVVGGATLG